MAKSETILALKAADQIESALRWLLGVNGDGTYPLDAVDVEDRPAYAALIEAERDLRTLFGHSQPPTE